MRLLDSLKIGFFDYRIFRGQPKDINVLDMPGSPSVFNTINPHSFYVAEHDPVFKQALQNSTLLLVDGVGVSFGNFLINNFFIKRTTGEDIFLHTLHVLHNSPLDESKRIFFLGSTNEVLEKISEKIKIEYPSLQAGFYSPPYKPEFSSDDSDKMLSVINAFKPYALFVGMTAPKQEKWVHANRSGISVKCIYSIGAVFDFYSGKIPRPNAIWRSLGLEWLGRFLSEPKRLWRRSLISLPYFLFRVLKEAIAKRFRKGV